MISDINTDKDTYFHEAYNLASGTDLEEVSYEQFTLDSFSFLLFDEKIVIDIYEMESYLSNEDTIQLIYDESEIGYITCPNSIDNPNSDLNNFTADEILYIWDFYRKKGYILDKLENYFMVLKKPYIETYLSKFYGKESLWGGFNHKKSMHISSKKLSTIHLPNLEISFPTDIHRFNSERSVLSNNIFYLFLSNYHNLELLFNLIFLRELRKIDIHNIEEANSIYKKLLNRDEFSSLKYLISSFIENNIHIYNIILKAFHMYPEITNELIYEYGKESNPIKDKDKIKFSNLVDKCILNNTSTFEEHLSNSKSLSFKGEEGVFKSFINEFITYFIYRLRCSIAHKKFGEFIFNNTEDHINFMIDIGIPIIKYSNIQIFSNASFKNIFNE